MHRRRLLVALCCAALPLWMPGQVPASPGAGAADGGAAPVQSAGGAGAGPPRPWQVVSPLTERGACPDDAVPGGTAAVLSIDGGGVRGIIPASILAYVEARAGQPIAGLFDLVAGASTGALIAAGLTKPGADGRPAYPAERIAEDYLGDVERLFPQGLLRGIEHTEGLLLPKYPEAELEALLRERVGDVRLSDLLQRVIVPTFDLTTNRPRVFDSALAKGERAHDFLVREMLRAATAAPSIYPPMRLRSLDGSTELIGVDGGVFLNNPEELAEAEARAAWPERAILLLSVGTGIQTAPVVDLRSNFGLLDWVPGILYVGTYGQEGVAALESVRELRLSRRSGVRDLRLNADLPHRSVSQFDSSPAHMQVLLDHAGRVIEAHRGELDDMVHRLLCARGR